MYPLKFNPILKSMIWGGEILLVPAVTDEMTFLPQAQLNEKPTISKVGF